MLGIAGPRLSTDERALFLAHRPCGVILFGRNIETSSQLSDLTAELREILPEGAHIAVDQEGGRVARLRPPYWQALPAAGSLLNAAQARDHGRALGQMVKAAGFTMTAAPVLDLHVPGASNVIGDRAIAGDAATVAELGGQIAAGIMDEGIIPIMKHLPGHGRALVDSHVSLPRVPHLTDDDLLPFTLNKDLPWAMTAHVVYEDIDPLNPATLSQTVIRDIIRGKIGFTGTLTSDDLAMGALTGAPAERALAALAAGCDVALYCPGDFAGNRAVLEALS
jgi:beta-N-acetylhexosaminidase